MATMAERFIPFPSPIFIRINDLLRFWAKVSKSPHPKGCWLWTAGYSRASNSLGELKEPYGNFCFYGITYYAHRVAWFFEKREDPGSLLVCHECNTTLCVNPRHLYLGTQSMNKIQCGLDDRANCKGEKGGRAKLNDDEARLILKSNLPGVILAKKFSISESSICDLRHGRTFRHLLMSP